MFGIIIKNIRKSFKAYGSIYSLLIIAQFLAVIILFSKAGAIQAIGFIEEPVCFSACVALFNPIELESAPNPPTVATT